MPTELPAHRSGTLWEGPVWGDLYLEHKDVYGLTIRAGLNNLFAADSMWDRTVHDGRRTGSRGLHRGARPADRTDLLVLGPGEVLGPFRC